MVLGKEFQLVKFRVLNKFQTQTLFWPVPQLFHLMVNEIFFFSPVCPGPGSSIISSSALAKCQQPSLVPHSLHEYSFHPTF